MIKTALLLVAGLALVGCAGRDPHVTESGKGKPFLTLSFPQSTAGGSEHDAVLEITNPGPGDMQTVVVAFAAVGPSQGQTELPATLVGVTVEGTDPSVIDVSPEPTGVSRDGVIYTFGPSGGEPRLPEGGSLTITFTIRVPAHAGFAANSVQVYDGSDIDRVAGVRMETLVER